MTNNNTYVVSDKRKQVWNCELNLYEEFRKICIRHNLTYYAISGTLLGAVRHNGFIPWDDDIDVGLSRNSYEEFLKYAKDELPEWIFLQTPDTDSDYFFGHAKLRKKNTTAIRKVLIGEELSYHQGIFVDIFPLDNIPDSALKHKIHRFVSLKLMQMIYYAKYHYKSIPHSKKENLKSMFCKIILSTNARILSLYKKYERYIQKYNNVECGRWGLISVFYAKESMFTWNKRDYNTVTELPFENTKMPAPIGYDNVLKSSFGDYMIPIRGGSQHGEIYYDIYHDYKEYLSGNLSIKDSDFDL